MTTKTDSWQAKQPQQPAKVIRMTTTYRRILIQIALVFVSVCAVCQTVIVSGADPTPLNGVYTYTEEVNGKKHYVNEGLVNIIWTGPEWSIYQGYDRFFYNPNDCGLEPPDEGWLVDFSGVTRPTLSGEVCDVKVVYVEGAGNPQLDGDYVLDPVGSTASRNKYAKNVQSPNKTLDEEAIVWSGTQWEIVHPYGGYINTTDCGAQAPASQWAVDPSAPVPPPQPAPTLSGDVCGNLPVEMTAFRALIRGSDVELMWETETETNNAGFEIQRADVKSAPESTGRQLGWQQIGFVAGHGNALEHHSYTYSLGEGTPGLYRFRLAQIDFDGSVHYSGELEVEIEVPMDYYMAPAYPNPFNPETTIQFAVREPQNVRLEIFDATGRMQRLVFEGKMGAHEPQTVRILANDLPSGVYLVRLVGERFEASQQVTLVK